MDLARDIPAKSSEIVTIQPPGHSRPSDIRTRPVVEPTQLSFCNISLRDTGVADLPLVGAAYECWSNVWGQTFQDLNVATETPSDEFTRQHEVSAIFHGYECIALFLTRHVDFSMPSTQADSYFSVWPKEAVQDACSRGSRICLSSNITISPAWRRPANCSLSLVLCGLIVERFLSTDCDVLIGTMRVDLKMNKLAYSVGAVPLKTGVLRHGVPVDLVAFYRDGCKRPKLDEETETFVQRLYSRA